jgi:hypothetical protein
VRRPLLGIVALPVVASGIFVAHAVAYRLLGAPSEGVHGYLAHVPQVLTLLTLPALLAAAVAGRSRTPKAWPFAIAALSTFVVQEHLERLAHTGELPFLLDRPVFLLGLALQLPFALVAWLGARWLLRSTQGAAARSLPRAPSLLLPLPEPSGAEPRPFACRTPAAPRAPPRPLPAR